MRDDAIVNHAKALGFKFPEDTDFLWLAEESLEVGLPEHWQQVVSEEGDGSLFFYNSDTDVSQWAHPLDADYRTRLKDLRAQRTKKKKRSKKKQTMLLFSLHSLPRSPWPSPSSCMAWHWKIL